MASQKIQIISSNDQGISNRIKCLVSAMLAAKENNGDLAVYWPLNDLCNSNFSDLFQNKIKTLSIEEYKQIKKVKKAIDFNTWRLVELKEVDKEFISFASKEYTRVYKSGEKGYVDFKYNEIPSKKRQKFISVFNQIRFHDDIIKSVDSIKKEVLESKFSMCIRTWHEAKERKLLFNPENIERIIENSNGKVFVSCDSDEYMNKLINKYKDKIVYYPKRTHCGDRQSTEGMQDILVDMKLVSLSKYIYIPYISTFPEVAWWLGACKAKIEIIETGAEIAYYDLKTLHKIQSDELLAILAGKYNLGFYFQIILKKLLVKLGLLFKRN